MTDRPPLPQNHLIKSSLNYLLIFASIDKQHGMIAKIQKNKIIANFNLGVIKLVGHVGMCRSGF